MATELRFLLKSVSLKALWQKTEHLGTGGSGRLLLEPQLVGIHPNHSGELILLCYCSLSLPYIFFFYLLFVLILLLEVSFTKFHVQGNLGYVRSLSVLNRESQSMSRVKAG